MKRNPFGWDYPPGAEFHPDAPWNQKEQPPECCQDCDNLVVLDDDSFYCDNGAFDRLEELPVTYHPDCPYDRRDWQEMKEDYQADQADNKRKYGKEA